MWSGSTVLQRCEALEAMAGVDVVRLDRPGNDPRGPRPSLYQRVRWKLGWPADAQHENEAILDATARERPDVVIIDNSRMIRRGTLRKLRELGNPTLVYYTPDDIGPHNLRGQVRSTFPEWDVFFTTKTYNIPELTARGVRRVVLIGKAFDPALHRPLTRKEVGEDFERWDLVFIGTYEKERRDGVNLLAQQGMSVVVYGNGWDASRLAAGVDLRPAKVGHDYTCAMHTGKVALCFLRKLNGDQITQRTMEIAAMARPMLANKTDEHDAHFVDGLEYVGFSNDDEFLEKARFLLSDDSQRSRIAAAANSRCWTSGYSTTDRAVQMVAELVKAVDQRASKAARKDGGT
jgi:hypothetical protein